MARQTRFLQAHVKLSEQPNAGKPREIEGRNLYLCSPDYMASYARRFINAGVRLVGGCCGTTPDHVRAIKNAVRTLEPAAVQTGGTAGTPPAARSAAGTVLESQTPGMWRSGWSTTAAATTGPARQPRPTSSQPATCTNPTRRSAFSSVRVAGTRVTCVVYALAVSFMRAALPFRSRR